MSILSGIKGCAKTSNGTISALGKWDLNPKSEVSEFASSATGRAMDRLAGNDDFEGNYAAYGDLPAVMPGAPFIFTGSLDGTAGVIGRAIAEEFKMKIDVEGGKEIEHSVKFACAFDGVSGHDLQFGSSATVDDSTSNVKSGSGCTFAVASPSAPSVWTVLDDVRTMDLTIKNSAKAYHSSSTYVPVGLGGLPRNWAGRLAGNMDLTFDVSVYQSDLNLLIPLKSIVGVRIYTEPPTVTNHLPTGGRYWQIRWGMIQSYSGIEIDRKNPGIIGATMQGGIKGVAAGGIWNPLGSKWAW